jgi:hypothetical protein
MRDASSEQREYSRTIAAYTLKQLIEWRASLKRLSEEHERESVQDSVDQHDHKGKRLILFRECTGMKLYLRTHSTFTIGCFGCVK